MIDSLALNRLDFDIEGAALADRGANQLHSAALKLVQQSHPDLEIWITLPVLPPGTHQRRPHRPPSDAHCRRQARWGESGTAAASGAYASIWGDYGTDPVISGGSGAGASSGGGSGDLSSLPTSNVTVSDSNTAISASDSSAKRFRLGYAWGRHLTIQGFNPRQNVLDLGGFWAEGQQAQVVAGSSGCSVVLGFNAQEVLLPGVDASALTSSVLAIWQG